MAAERADHWEVETVERIPWRSVDQITEAEIRVSCEVPLSKDGKRLPRDPWNRWYPAMADVEVDDECPFRLLLGDDLRSLAAALLKAAATIDRLDGQEEQVAPGQVGAFDAA